MRDIRALVNKSACNVETGKDAANLANQMEPIRYSCPVCEEVYSTKAKAIECRDQPFDTGGLKIGDIVVVPSKWAIWYEDDNPWIAFTLPVKLRDKDHFKHTVQKVPYFVVTAVHGEERDPHRCLVTLVSLCSDGIRVGWNPANGVGHYAMYRIDGGKHCDGHSTWIEVIEPYLEKCKPSEQMLEEAARLARIGISTRNLL